MFVKSILPALALVICPAFVDAQEFSAWSPAINLGPAVNKSTNEGCPFIAKNELTLFVVSIRAEGYGGQDIYISHRDSVYDAWGPLENLGPTVNSASDDLCPTLSVDGYWLYMVSSRPGGCGGQDLYVAHRQNNRDDFGWEAPVNLGCTVNSSLDDYTPTLFEDDATGHTVLFFSSNRPGGIGDVDIYSSTLGPDGHFGFSTVVPELSTAFNDERPNIRKDGLEIFFNSTRPGGSGSADLWTSTRERTTDPWSPPVNLGALVNTSSNEMRASLSFDGATLYFNSNRPGGFGGSDIYVTTRNRPLLTLSSTRYCTGDRWSFAGIHAKPGAFVRVMGVFNGASWEIPRWGQADANGRFAGDAIIGDNIVGNHVVNVEVNGLRSNAFWFVVSKCKP